MTSLQTNLLQETKELLTRGKEILVRVAYNLHSLRESEEWKQYGHDTFPKFCQEELELPQSSVSKYLAVAEFFAREYQPEQIGPIDIEKLYLSSKLEGTPEENLAKAKTWSRDDFKQNKAEIEPHEGKWITYCDICKLSQANHPTP